jgi:hypothetical protein
VNCVHHSTPFPHGLSSDPRVETQRDTDATDTGHRRHRPGIELLSHKPVLTRCSPKICRFLWNWLAKSERDHVTQFWHIVCSHSCQL